MKDHYYCALLVAVHANMCGVCPYVDKDVPPIVIHRQEQRDKPCIHLGESLREADGRAKTKWCETCNGGSKLKLFHCLKGHGEITGAECRTCTDYKRKD